MLTNSLATSCWPCFSPCYYDREKQMPIKARDSVPSSVYGIEARGRPYWHEHTPSYWVSLRRLLFRVCRRFPFFTLTVYFPVAHSSSSILAPYLSTNRPTKLWRQFRLNFLSILPEPTTNLVNILRQIGDIIDTRFGWSGRGLAVDKNISKGGRRYHVNSSPNVSRNYLH